MNKTQLVDALAERLGDRRTAATAVDGLLETIVDTVRSGDSVTLTGFGVFEGRARAARLGRNPRTGETIEVPATTIPAFRPGAGFRTAVGGGGAPAPRPARRSPQTAAASTSAGSAPALTVVADAPGEPRTAKVATSFAGKDGRAGKQEKQAKAERVEKPKAAKGKAEKPKKAKSKK
jgi:DNA-binding protein HU-beta